MSFASTATGLADRGTISPPVIDLLAATAGYLRALMEQRRGAPADTYTMAGLPVSLCFLDEQLRRQVAPAFQHLRLNESNEPELTVYVAGLLPQFANLPHQLAALGLGEFEVLSLRLDGMQLMVHRQGQGIGALDQTGKIACWLELVSTGMPYLDQAAPMRHLLTAWFSSRHRYLFHGAAVGVAGKGVLILGNGGAGKTTTALACLEAGMQFIGDDRCLLSMTGVATVDSLYGTAKLADRARFPFLAGDLEQDGIVDKEKAMYRLQRGQLQQQLQLRAILLARIENRPRSEVHPLSAKDGYMALAPSAALHLPQGRRAALECFQHAARRLPVYALQLGSDIASTPPVVRQVLSQPE